MKPASLVGLVRPSSKLVVVTERGSILGEATVSYLSARDAHVKYAEGVKIGTENNPREHGRVILSTGRLVGVPEGLPKHYAILREDAEPGPDRKEAAADRDAAESQAPLAPQPTSADDQELITGDSRLSLGVTDSLPDTLEAIPEAEIDADAEGIPRQVLSTKYERSPLNRRLAVSLHGLKCNACGFNFERIYGPVGHDFIEVHHVSMLADADPGGVTNPRKDMTTLFSNCHAMAHRRRPPYDVAEIKSMIATAAYSPAPGAPSASTR